MPLFGRTTGHYDKIDKIKEISCHDCFRENSLQRPAAATAKGYVFASFNSIMVGVLMVAIVITSTGATFGVLMTLFSFANCLGDIVLCIIPFFLRKKYPHAPFEEREAECAAMDAGK